MLLLLPLRPLLNDLLSLGIDLLVIDLTSRLALLALGLLASFDADGGSTAAADLLLGFFPCRATVVDLVSGDCKSVIVIQ